MPLGRFLHTTLAPRPAADADLLARFVADRDEAAFATLLARHGPAVFGVCRRILGHTHDAEDAAQAVFVVLARNAAAIRRRTSLAAWLHGVAVRVCRKALARRRPTTPIAAEPVVKQPASWEDGLRAIDEALSTLPESLRQPLVLCYLNGLSRDEAAAELGLGEATFRGRLDRGKARLRRELERRGFPLAVGLIGTALTTNPLPAATLHATLDVALGAVPPPAPVAPLTTGVLSVPHLKIWLTGLFVVSLLAAGVCLYLQPTAHADPFTHLTQPDPKAGKAEARLDGVWTATQEAGMTKRDTRLQFVDGQHLVWETTVTQSNLPAPIVMTLKMKYQITKEGELKAEVLEKWAGEDKLKPSENDLKPRTYTITWEKDGKSFTLKTVPASDSPWATLAFTRGEEKVKVVDPLVPDSLAKI
ncbi:MAG: RNA polymerase sigma factor, partial [Gemmataceae bacterium]